MNFLLRAFLLGPTLLCSGPVFGEEGLVPILAVPKLIETDDSRSAPIESKKELITQLYRIPAPRGLILDRYGNPLAQTRAVEYLAVRILALQSELDLEPALERLQASLAASPELAEYEFSVADFTAHWEHRPHVPFPLSGPLSPEKIEVVRGEASKFGFLSFETTFLREYPAGPAFAHVTGFTRPSMPYQHGPLAEPENMWPPSAGSGGIEGSHEEALRGKPGIASYLYGARGQVEDVELIESPVPGDVVVTTLNRPMQELAYRILSENGKPGALVAVDSLTGDILALGSYPSFDPNAFIEGVSSETYRALEEDPSHPMFPRATMGAYPPGSTFKPFVAMAALDTGAVAGIMTRFPTPPSIEIDGRTFRNWSGKDEGLLDVRYAILRSSNTWFYQAGFQTGGRAILQTARSYGFGRKPEIGISSNAGNIPAEKNVLAPQAVANFSIGQGELLVTPLQLGIAMAGLSTGSYVPAPRLVIQSQDPLTNTIKGTNAVQKISLLNSRESDRLAVRAGMWGVVNHASGTGGAAVHGLPEVYGKTGTSQWSARGKKLNLAWFAGYVGSNSPRIAFAVLVQGREGESVSGGKDAAPLIGRFVKEIYANPDTYRVEVTVRTKSNPLQNTPIYTPSYPQTTSLYSGRNALRRDTSRTESIRNIPPPGPNETIRPYDRTRIEAERRNSRVILRVRPAEER